MGEGLERWQLKKSFGSFGISLGGREVNWLVVATKAKGKGSEKKRRIRGGLCRKPHIMGILDLVRRKDEGCGWYPGGL